MVLKIYAVFDVKASNYGQPFFMTQHGLAVRAFSDLAQDDKASVSKHPEDYKLYCLGEYDDNSGKFVSLSVPEFINNATDFIVN